MRCGRDNGEHEAPVNSAGRWGGGRFPSVEGRGSDFARDVDVGGGGQSLDSRIAGWLRSEDRVGGWPAFAAIFIVGPLACISKSRQKFVGGRKRGGIWRVMGGRGHRLASGR